MSWHTYYAETTARDLYYEQFTYEGCSVGCGPVAWTILFCWGDQEAERGNTYWNGRFGLYRKEGGRGENATAPGQDTSDNQGPRNVSREIHEQVNTFCTPDGQGATVPWDMAGAEQYLSGRTFTKLRINKNDFGFTTSGLRDCVRNSIIYRRTPAVIGTGWLSHYAVAYGYRWRTRLVRKYFLWWSWLESVTDRQFKVNQGIPGRRSEWVPADTWFAGEILP